VVNYANFLHFIDEALLSWWDDIHGSPQPPGEVGLATRWMACAWTEAVIGRVRLEAAVSVAEVGRSSFGMYCALRVAGRESPCFVARMVQVHVAAGGPVLLPAKIRTRLRRTCWDLELRACVEKLVRRAGRRRAPALTSKADPRGR
jgi:acyl-CoA thioesterase FadM